MFRLQSQLSCQAAEETQVVDETTERMRKSLRAGASSVPEKALASRIRDPHSAAFGGRYSGTLAPEPPSSAGKSLSFGSPSFIRSTVSA